MSRWIGPNTDAKLDGPPGLYKYETTFLASGTGTVDIYGRWTTDNEGFNILLDGAPIDGPPPLILRGTDPGPYSFESWHDFVILGVGVGAHTLDFIVQNDEDGNPNPTGVRVEFAIPEPTTIIIWTLLGGLGIVFVKWQRGRKTA